MYYNNENMGVYTLDIVDVCVHANLYFIVLITTAIEITS